MGLNGAARVDVLIGDPENVVLHALDDEALLSTYHPGAHGARLICCALHIIWLVIAGTRSSTLYA